MSFSEREIANVQSCKTILPKEEKGISLSYLRDQAPSFVGQLVLVYEKIIYQATEGDVDSPLVDQDLRSLLTAETGHINPQRERGRAVTSSTTP
jgi:hypothetical protein